MDLVGETHTFVHTVDPTVNDDISSVQNVSRSDGDVEIVILEGFESGAQAGRSSEPEMVVSQVVPEVTFSTHTGRFRHSGFDQCS